MGHGKDALHQDPGLLKWYKMHTNRYKYFRWTKRTALITTMYVIVVPAMFATLGAVTDGKYEMRGKRRGDTIVEF